MAYNKKEHLQNNISAISLMFTLDRESRPATDVEQVTLRKYSGFGGLKCILNPIDDINKWADYEKPLYPLVQELFQTIRDNTNDSDNKKYISSVKESVLTAYYTPPAVVSAITSTLAKQGIAIKNVLEPSAGSGVFVDEVLATNPQAQVVAYEKDILTGEILKHIHPDHQVNVDGFETIPTEYNDKFDLVISNIPFGDFRVFDPAYYGARATPIQKRSTNKIHNYFVVKSIDALRDGGVLAFITTQGFLNSPENSDIRYWLEENTNILSTLRLPNNLFTESANTEVGSDLIVVQKTSTSIYPTKILAPLTTENGIKSCSCFAEDKNVIFTDKAHGLDLYGKPAVVYTHSGGSDGVAQAISVALESDLERNFNKQLFIEYGAQKDTVAMTTNVPTVSTSPEAPIASLYDLFGFSEDERSQITSPKNRTKTPTLPIIQTVKPPKPSQWTEPILNHYRENVFVIDKNGAIGYLSDFKRQNIIFHPFEPTKAEAQKMKDYIMLRDAYHALYEFEATERVANPEYRDTLNQKYDAFVAQYGQLRSKNNRDLSIDSLMQDMLSIERVENEQFVKSDIFHQPVSFAIEELTTVNSHDEALVASLNKYGAVDFTYMSYLTSTDPNALRADLDDKVYFDPISKTWEIKDKYLSGNVVRKAKEVEEFLRQNPTNREAQISLEALKKVRPRKINFEELDFNFGERWISNKVYSKFASDFFGTPVDVSYVSSLDTYRVTCDSLNLKIMNEYAVHGEGRTHNGIALMNHAIMNTTPVITKTIHRDGEDIKVPDYEKIQLANTFIEQMRTGFSEWLLKQPQDLTSYLTEKYNELFNCYVKPNYNGSHQTFPDLNYANLNIPSLYDSQKDAVWMLLQNGGGIIDHEVGGGKTNIICVAAYEMKRLKLANKPLVIAMKANVQAIANTYRKAYPNAKILAPSATDFKADKRIALFQKIKNNNWDVVIMSHDQFKSIPQSLERQQEFFGAELAEVEANLDVLRKDGTKISKQMERGLLTKQINLRTRLQGLGASLKAKRDDIPDFDKLGFDHIFVDESHIFKNLSFSTRHSRVAGLGTQKGSERAANLDIALRTIQHRTQKDLGATFLSGTTITNSLTELYLLFKYLRPRELAAQQLNSFDAWAAVYAKKTADFEPSVTQELIMKERFRYFIKVPELAAFYNEITDYKTAKDIKLDRPEQNFIFHQVPRNEAQTEYISRVMEFAKTGNREIINLKPKLGNSQQSDGRMLVATSKLSDASMDMRFIDSEKYSEDRDSKLTHCAQNIAKYYKQYDEHKGTQFVFSNRRNNSESGWDFYVALKEKLVDYGIPSNEILFAQNFDTEKKKDKMCNLINSGECRVILGSTEVLGTGINAQERAVAVHHVDIPWRPSDLEQRNGRAVRTGNRIAKHFADNKVDVIVYGVMQTLDAYKLGLLQNKQFFIDQIKRGSAGSRSVDEGAIDQDGSIPFAECLALISGNQDLLEKAKLDKKIMALESERKTFYKNQSYSKTELAFVNDELGTALKNYSRIQEDWEHFQQVVEVNNSKVLNPLQIIGVPNGATIEQINVKLQGINRTVESAQPQKIGSIYDFNIYVRRDNRTNITKFSVGRSDNELKYSFNNGILATDPKLATSNFIRALEQLPTYLERGDKKILELKRQHSRLSPVCNTSWVNQSQLDVLKENLSAVERRLFASTSHSSQPKKADVNLKPKLEYSL